MMTPLTESVQFEIRRPARMLLSRGEETGPLVIALHGYAMNAPGMLDLTRQLLGPGPVIASLEAPNSFQLGRDPRTRECGYNWGTRETAEFHGDVHRQFVEGAIGHLSRMYQAGPERFLLLGYSQSVGLNYRFIAANPGAVRGVLALVGGVPANWEESAASIGASVYHISRAEDEFFPSADVARFESRLRLRAADVEFQLLPGRHRFPLKAAPQVHQWIRRVYPSSTAP